MADSNLNLSMADLTGEVGFYRGWGRDPARWTVDKIKDIRECTASCLRKFYFQAKISERDEVHGWTFLAPVATVLLVSGSSTSPLPEDFGGFEGLASVSQSGATGGYWPLAQVHEEQIRVRYAANSSQTGRPVAYAETQKKGTTPNRSNRSELIVFPTPDAAYTLQVPYYFLPDYLTIQNPYPYGGAAHAETMKAGARAAAELFLDGEAGTESANYMQCLAASISYDRRHQPKTLGVNTDHSDMMAQRSGRWPDGLWSSPWGIGYIGLASYV